jgi:hypothetical protein
MSTVPAPQPRSRQPSNTREQLDELDALLQRMLELPVDPTGGEGPPLEAGGRAPTALAEAPPDVHVVRVVVPPGPVEGAALPAVARALEQPPPTPLPPAPGLSSLSAQATAPQLVQPPDGPPLWLRSLVQVNRQFDRWVERLGAPGRLLRRPLGRALLGCIGLGLLAASVGLLLQWFGWF